MATVGQGFRVFHEAAGDLAAAHFEFIKAHQASSSLDAVTSELAYLSVLAATGMVGGVAFHVATAKSLGASRDDVMSAILVGLPAVGLCVLDSLPVALEAFDVEDAPA